VGLFPSRHAQYTSVSVVGSMLYQYIVAVLKELHGVNEIETI
jgi:hypothetical protein